MHDDIDLRRKKCILDHSPRTKTTVSEKVWWWQECELAGLVVVHPWSGTREERWRGRGRGEEGKGRREGEKKEERERRQMSKREEGKGRKSEKRRDRERRKEREG